VHQDGTRAASRRVDDQPERLAIDGSVAGIDPFGVEDEIGTPHHGRLAEDERRVDFVAKALRNGARELASLYDAPTDPGQTAFELLSLPGREIDPTRLHASPFLKIKVILGRPSRIRMHLFDRSLARCDALEKPISGPLRKADTTSDGLVRKT